MTEKPSTAAQGSQLITDVGPVGLFILTYFGASRFVGHDAIYWATGVFIVAMLAALFYARAVQKRWPLMLLFSAVIVTFMGGIGILLQDPIFIFMKPTIVNLFISYLVLVGFAFGVNIWKVFLGTVFDLPDRIWTILAIRWALFFQFLALLNELLWRHITDSTVAESARWIEGFEISEAVWVNFKLVVMGLSLVFALLNLPIVLKHQRDDTPADPAPTVE
tara:strand:+ start:228 stop:887 length:660 start_codon:yes stop_codon:yes gene_type:complete